MMTLQIRRSFALAAGVGMLAIVLTVTGAGSAIAQNAKPLLTLVVNDAAQPVPVRTVASSLTHLGRPAADVVALRWWLTAGCFKQMDATGLAAADCYVPAAGQKVIVTDVLWSAGNAPGVSVVIHIFDQGVVFQDAAVAGSSGIALSHRHLQTGFVFDPALRVDVSAFMVLRGYVVPAE